MTLQVDWQELHDALEQVEFGLESPRISGELESWLKSLAIAFGQMTPLLQRRIATAHEQQFAQIMADDPGLLPRVSHLRRGDVESLQQSDTIQKRLATLLGNVRKVEPDEGLLDDQITALIDQGLEFVIHVRTQENAIRTWSLEALERDRGTVD